MAHRKGKAASDEKPEESRLGIGPMQVQTTADMGCEPRGSWLRCQRRPRFSATSTRCSGRPKWQPVRLLRANILGNRRPPLGGVRAETLEDRRDFRGDLSLALAQQTARPIQQAAIARERKARQQARAIGPFGPLIGHGQQPATRLLRRVDGLGREAVPERVQRPVGLALVQPRAERRVFRILRRGRDPRRHGVQVDERAVADDHPNLAVLLHHLSELHCFRGEYAEAEPFGERSLAIWEGCNMSERRLAAACFKNLANLYRAAAGHWGEERVVSRRSLAVPRTCLCRSIASWRGV